MGSRAWFFLLSTATGAFRTRRPESLLSRKVLPFYNPEHISIFVEDHVLKLFALPPAVLRLNRQITFQDVFRGRHAEQFNSFRDNLLLAFEFDKLAARRLIKHHLQFRSVRQRRPVNRSIFLIPKPFSIAEAFEDRHGATRVINRGLDFDPFLEL